MPLNYQHNSNIFVAERQESDYESIGRELLLYLTTHHSNEVLEAQQQAVTSHLYVGMVRIDDEQNDYSTRLAMELDLYLFSLFTHHYAEESPLIYQEPIFT